MIDTFRKRLRQPCQAGAKQNRPLPTKVRAEAQKRSNQPASTLRRLASTATKRKMTQTLWLNRVGVCFPKRTPCQNAQRKADFCCPSLLLSRRLKGHSPREPTHILEKNGNPNLKNHFSSGPTNATFTCAGADDQSLCQSPNSKPSEASRQRQVEGLLGKYNGFTSQRTVSRSSGILKFT